MSRDRQKERERLVVSKIDIYLHCDIFVIKYSYIRILCVTSISAERFVKIRKMILILKS